MMEDVHEQRDQLTIWLRPDLKKGLYIHSKIDEGFKHRRLMNRANKASAKSSKYIGGSTTFMKTKAKLTKDDDDNSSTAEVDLDMVWHEIGLFKPYKDRVYRSGSFFANNLRTTALRHSSASTTSWHVDPDDGIDLRKWQCIKSRCGLVAAVLMVATVATGAPALPHSLPPQQDYGDDDNDDDYQDLQILEFCCRLFHCIFYFFDR
ncbi:hypothetical protein Ahy_B05g078287 [Arachis hypogaea]|uniref:Uncharacterized protein n=1 Tax=Arachis hypogaea TaxID=3818 RepID=A0A444Z6R3_ARAHY|nr:hypothetical protein Ahy_B05g078287 [Arachis hypogaea]